MSDFTDGWVLYGTGFPSTLEALRTAQHFGFMSYDIRRAPLPARGFDLRVPPDQIVEEFAPKQDEPATQGTT